MHTPRGTCSFSAESRSNGMPPSASAAPHHIASLLRLAGRRRSTSLLRQLHARLVKSGVRFLSPLPSLLLDSYAKCGLLADAHHLFDETPNRDPVLWSSLLAAHSHSPHPHIALSLFRQMVSSAPPDGFVLATIVKTCGRLGSIRLGKQAHAYFVTSSFSDDDVVKSAMVDMYSKLCFPGDARKVFDTILQKNYVCWTAMVSGFASNGRNSEAIELFQQMPEKSLLSWTALISGFIRSGNCFGAMKLFVDMRRDGVMIDDAFVLSCLVSAAANMAALELGKQLHCFVVALGFESGLIVGNSLVDMYAKCSDICSARVVFEGIYARDIVSWTTMVVGEAQHGKAEQALSLFDGMIHHRVKPNGVTFVGLMYACSHAGLVQKGRELFDSMTRDFGIAPTLQHYTCLLDLLSRSGHLSEAETIMRTMPYEPDEAAWAALLSACKKHGDIQMSIRIADHLLGLKPRNPSTYILLSNTYAAAGKWDCVANLRKLMESRDIRKEPGYSWIELRKENCLFRAGEVPHNMRDEILALLEELVKEMKKIGYVPDTNSVMHDLEEHEKEQHLFLHSERLAVAYGLLKSVPGTVIRVVKNLRVCSDCHVFLKLISSIAMREIVVRDASRFHHFKVGKCSCGDFW